MYQVHTRYFHHHFYFPAQLVGFTLSDLLDKPWSQVSSLPGTRPHFYRTYGSAFPLLVDFHRMLLTHALALSAASINNQLLECLRKYVFKNVLFQKLSRRQYLRYFFEKKAKMYFIEGRF